MLKTTGFDIPDISMDVYMKARALTQGFTDDWLGRFINPQNKFMSSLLLGCGSPGDMMGSMIADLTSIYGTINNTHRKEEEEELLTDDMFIKLLNEVVYV